MKYFILFIFVLTKLSLFSQTIPSYVPLCGLVAWYPFSGNAFDSSGNGHNGTVYGATLTADRFGHANSAYSFNGINNYILIPSGMGGPGLDITGSVSISTWVQTNDYTYSSAEQVFWRGDPTTAHDNYMIYINGPQVNFRRDVGSGLTVNEIGYPSSGIDASFHHFVGTYDSISGYMSLYFDGNLVNQVLMPGIESYPTSTFWNIMGAVDNGNWQFFYGTIDDIGIWNRALTPCEVSNLFYCLDICNCFNDSLNVNETCDSISLPDSINVCMNSSLVLPATLIGTTTPSSILWSPPTGLSNPNILNPNLNVGTQSAWYYLTIYINNISDQLVCKVNDSIFVEVNLVDTLFTSEVLNVCTANGPISLNGPSGYASYIWNTGQSSSSVVVDNSGLYWVSAVNGSCRLLTDTFHTTFFPSPIVSLGDDTTICVGITLALDAQVESIAKYIWNTGSTESSIEVSKSGEYKVTVTQNGCSTTDSVQITIDSPPNLSLEKDTTLCSGSVLSLFLRGNNTDYLWSTGSTDSIVEISDAGKYWVRATNICGTTFDTISVNFIFCNLWFPTAFTPNGDGKNDVIGVVGSLAEYNDFSLAIFNRWGQRVFYSRDIKEGWNGTFNGVKQDIGTYFYRITASLNGTKNDLKGDFQLIR